MGNIPETSRQRKGKPKVRLAGRDFEKKYLSSKTFMMILTVCPKNVRTRRWRLTDMSHAGGDDPKDREALAVYAPTPRKALRLFLRRIAMGTKTRRP